MRTIFVAGRSYDDHDHAGWCWFDGQRSQSGAVSGLTFQQALLMACREAVLASEPGEELTFVADTEYLVTGLAGAMTFWQHRGWTTVSGTPVQFQSDWQALVAVIESQGVLVNARTANDSETKQMRSVIRTACKEMRAVAA